MDKVWGLINPQERGGSRIMTKRGSKGELPMYINSTHFPKLVICIQNFYFFIECSQIQSLNTCKRVGVSGHIPKLLCTWGLIKISSGKCVIQSSRPKERKFICIGTQILHNNFG
jgi:hypothetical protein